MLWFDLYEFRMFREHSGDFYDVWENFGKKGKMVILRQKVGSGSFVVFRTSRWSRNGPIMSGLKDRIFLQDFWCLEGVSVKVVFSPDFWSENFSGEFYGFIALKLDAL